MARIVSVSYDETLLLTRELLLKAAGHQVTSCLGYVEALKGSAMPFDLAIVGHSIPKQDKLDMIAAFRQHNPQGIILALTRAGEGRLNEVDVYVTPGNPEEIIRAIDRVLKSTRLRAKEEAEES